MEELIHKLDLLDPLIDAVGTQETQLLASFLAERISNPEAYLVFLGETNSGKSSLINGLIGRNLLPVKACSSTAAITEVQVADCSEDQYLAIKKDATVEYISYEDFVNSALSPSDNISRLRVTTSVPDKHLKGLRIFDTPGFDSIVGEHEEVLKDFLPNSDVVVYVVSYRDGIRDPDFKFLWNVKDLIRDDVEVVLVVNKCPKTVSEHDRRIKEITRYAQDILTMEPHIFYAVEALPEEGELYALPKCEDMWHYVSDVMSSESRQQMLKNAFDGYIRDLFLMCDSILQSRYASSKMDRDILENLNEEQRQRGRNIRNAIDTILIPAFEEIEKALPSKFQKTGDEVVRTISKKVDESSAFDKQEMKAYVNSHLLPYTVRTVSNDHIVGYMEVMLNELNDKLDDYIQKEFTELQNSIEIQLDTAALDSLKGILKRTIASKAENELLKYCIQLGGFGGANAGIANAASHALKKIGAFFGHKFSRGTHNALKHFLKKTGITKGLGPVMAVVFELAFGAIDIATWKVMFKKKLPKSIEEWRKEQLESLLRDIRELKETNIKTIEEIACDIETSFPDAPGDVEKARSDAEMSDRIRIELGIIN